MGLEWQAYGDRRQDSSRGGWNIAVTQCLRGLCTEERANSLGTQRPRKNARYAKARPFG